MSAKVRILAVILLIATMLPLSAIQSAAGPNPKIVSHEQPFGDAGGLGIAAWSTFDNPNYYYAPITNAPSGVYYRQAGLSPDGTKIVAVKTWTEGAITRRETVLMNADGTGEVVISPGDSGEGDIYQYGNPFWSDDGTAVGFVEVHNTNPNKVMRYDLATGTRTYIYEPTAPDDVANPDFLGASKTAIVFWDYGAGGDVADLFIWDGTTRTNITNTADYKEYEPISNADGTKIVYWSGETTAEPVNHTHTLTYSGGVWVKDLGFTPIPGSYWSYWTTPAATHIATTMITDYSGTIDLYLYDATGTFVADLTGPGYTGGTGQWNFFGCMPQGPNGEFVITSNAGRTDPGRDIVIVAPRSALYVDDSGSDSNPGTEAAPFATIQKGVDEAIAGGTVHVAAGTYDGTINVDSRSNLTIVGADKDTTIVKPATTLPWNVGGYGSSRQTVARVVNSTGITFSNLTFDFDLVKANGVFGFLYWDSTGTVSNSILKNMSVPDASGGYYEFGSYIRAPSYTDAARAQVSFTGNTFIDAGRVAILTHEYVYAVISGNTFYKVMDDFGYAMEIGSQSTASIANNTIYGYDTPAASDNSTSAGIYIENCFTGGSPHVVKNVTLSGNEVYDSQYALYIGNEFDGYAGDVDIVLTATGNNFHNNVDGAVIIADEDKSAGSSVTATFEDNTLTSNGDVGYFIYTNGDGDITVSIDGDSITGHDVGVYLNDYATGPSGSSYNVAIHQSTISGNTTYGVQNEYAGTTIDAELNYWGDTTGPYHSTNPNGQGNAVSDNVDFSPWLGATPGSSPMTYGATPGTNIGEVINQMQPGDTLILMAGNHTGGIHIAKGITLRGEPGTVIGPGSDGITVTANDVTIMDVTLDGTGGDPGDVGIRVADGVQRLHVEGCEIRNWPDDGIHFNGAITGLKVVDNYIHNNGGDGMEFNGTPAGTVQIYGNALRANTGSGINAASGSVVAEYNEWGDIAGPTGTNGDGVSGTVDYDPWVFGAVYADVVPDPARVREGENVNVDIKVDTANLYGAQFSLTFDPVKLQVVSTADGDFKGSQDCHTTYNNGTGTLTFYCSRGGTDAAVSGTGVKLLTITFQAQEIVGTDTTATIDLDAASVRLGAVGGVNIYVDSVTDDTLTIYGTTDVSGVVDLQGRSNDSGAVVTFPAGILYAGGTDTTDSWGRYDFAGVTDGSYLVTIEMARYLDASATVNVAGDTLVLNTVVLLGGDVNDSDEVDISDLSSIGGKFGQSVNPATTPEDINYDGVVDILDLVLAAGNYTKTSSPWTP